MGKQHTFRTTKDTEWMDEILNNMGCSGKSEFIRNAIADRLETHIPVKTTGNVRQNLTWVSDKRNMTSDIPIEEILEEVTETTDVEAGFKNLQNMFS